jgi:hypothetical protein
MLNSIKLYIALCLIGLQFIAPFIHAHAFGLDTFSERSLHVHADVQPVAALQLHDLQPEASNALIQHSVEQHSGYIITVASGINSSTDADAMLNPLLGIALLMVFALMLMSLPPSLIFSTTPSLALKQLSYPSQNPRAPPR